MDDSFIFPDKQLEGDMEITFFGKMAEGLLRNGLFSQKFSFPTTSQTTCWLTLNDTI